MAAVIVMASACVPVPPALVAVMVALKVPAADGVPEMMPLLTLTVSPAGKPVAPKLVGELVAVIEWVNDEPATPLAVVGLVMAGAGGLMTMVTFWVALGAVPLAAWTVKPNEPAVVGVPLNMPLVALRVRPAGSAPVAMLQVIGVVPVAVKLWV